MDKQQQQQQTINKTTTRQNKSLMAKQDEVEIATRNIHDPSDQPGVNGGRADAAEKSLEDAARKELDDDEDEVNEHEVSKYNHQCYICDKIFSANSNLNRHLRKIHKENVQSPYNNVKCALCENSCPSSSMYITHLKKDHQVNIEIDNLTFPDKQTFEDWKYGVEDGTMSQFIKSRGEKRTKSVNKTYYSCNRSGYYVSKARTQKALKKQGSRKINGRCPASMNVTVNPDSSYDVRFIKTHVGHDFSLKHLDLSEKDRDLIIKKLAAGVTKKDIIKQIRSTAELHHPISSTNISPASSVSGAVNTSTNTSSIQPIVISSRDSLVTVSGDSFVADVVAATSETLINHSAATSSATTPIPMNQQNGIDGNISTSNNGVPTSRIHLATTKDIHNILNSKHLDSKKIRHNYDLNQFEAWVDEMKLLGEDSGVLLYKNQGEECGKYPKLQSDDFMLVLMKPGQAYVFKEHGARCVILESTHNVHCEYLHVAYLAVVDQQQKGFPIAFMFSTRTDSDIMEVFFSLIKDRVGLISTRMLIADEQHEFYQAWWRVMSMPLHNLLSPWTVFDNWSKKFELVRTREKLRKLKKQLRVLLNETEHDKFNRTLKQMSLDYHLDPDVLKFMDYFDEHYGRNPEVWSGCLRKTYNVSNYQLWCLHDKFKTVYKEGKNSKKMSKFVSGFMNLFEDYQLGTLQKLEDSDQEAKKRSLDARHERAIATVPLIYEVAVQPVYWLCPADGTLNDVYEEVRHTNHNAIAADQQELQQDKVVASKSESKRPQRSTRRDSGRLGAETIVAKVEDNQLPSKSPQSKTKKCCDLNCPDCACCRHDYECTCLDYVFNLSMCKHIHRVCNMSKTWT